ncbi:hypothetical protein DFA_06345 [Cavenderia fasciculata]|uniref:Peptidase S8/S53 domain-containing protein n=1 Tax=Cavenderia fasciculata TaxID=261658 RepID=F4PKS4_CACFS|nr:uncharacterized protein DFA_06345 [Cavenderia fasciculata]EGG24198.1 hypothetical protein DFA_06345 [Cavenderia fasciculata]|eukprot:XP_004362049.1 hypothetical protein DFA_06345 [Cavenderia fasciculata]
MTLYMKHLLIGFIGCLLVLMVVHSKLQQEQQVFQDLDNKVSNSVKLFFGEKYTQDSIQRSQLINKQLGLNNNNEQQQQQQQPTILPKPDTKRTKLWVFLNEKEGKDVLLKSSTSTTSSNKMVSNTANLINNIQSIDRRIRRGQFEQQQQKQQQSSQTSLKHQQPTKMIVNEKDLPISESIVDRIMKCDRNDAQLTVHHRIKWINAISVSLSTQTSSTVASEVLRCISGISQVDRVELVNRFYKPKFDNDNEELDKLAAHIQQENILVEADIAPRRRILSSDEQDRAFYNNTFNAATQINVPVAHSNGYNGTGVIILMMDSGYLKNHTAFAHLTFLDEYDFVDNKTDTQGPMGDPQNTHGTATLSTIGGFVPGVMVGPAYLAHYLLAKTEDTSAEYVEEEDNWIAAVQWGEERGADMLSSSLGYTDWYKYYQMDSKHAPITMAADAAAERGMTVVVSAGNSGEKGIGAPADGMNVLAIAAIDQHGNTASFSSRGPSSDGRVKPDVSALGVANFVASASDARYYTRMSGTSFACPMTGGAVALILQAHPNWTPAMVYEAITQTASHPEMADVQQGFGIVNTWAAINYVPTNLSTHDSCDTVGCSGHGGCCDGQCACAADRYGTFCQFEKVACGAECLFRGGKCVLDQFDFSYVCGDINGPSHVNQTITCDVCTDAKVDVCGVCGGAGKSCVGCDGVPFSGKVVDVCGTCGGNGACKAVVPEPDNADNKNTRLKIIIGSVIGGTGFLLIIGAIIIVAKKNRDRKGMEPFLGFPGRGYETLRTEDFEY